VLCDVIGLGMTLYLPSEEDTVALFYYRTLPSLLQNNETSFYDIGSFTLHLFSLSLLSLLMFAIFL
jgi:hypothetical protein